MSTNKNIREMTNFLQSISCNVVVVKTKNHIKYYVKKDKYEKMFVTSTSASDERATKNMQADFKRWLRSIDTKGEEHASS